MAAQKSKETKKAATVDKEQSSLSALAAEFDDSPSPRNKNESVSRSSKSDDSQRSRNREKDRSRFAAADETSASGSSSNAGSGGGSGSGGGGVGFSMARIRGRGLSSGVVSESGRQHEIDVASASISKPHTLTPSQPSTLVPAPIRVKSAVTEPVVPRAPSPIPEPVVLQEPPEEASGLICLLCRRKFESPAKYQQHKDVSKMHQDNLRQWRLSHGLPADGPQQIQYVDRAAQRRLRDGVTDAQVAAVHRESLLSQDARYNPRLAARLHSREETVNELSGANAFVEPAAAAPALLSENNVGYRMLKSMKWSEGEGLGREGKGITAPIEVEHRQERMGLGMRSSGMGFENPEFRVAPGDSFVEATKKKLLARYEEKSLRK
eukprot:c3702_g1_i2.p1 GENE.c3702_g1_i2~~c3702_g1_i2.p1  ORF type:complete len:379 (+),score=107.96 c3702_g1_i2:1105-2241(+)